MTKKKVPSSAEYTAAGEKYIVINNKKAQKEKEKEEGGENLQENSRSHVT